MSNNIGLIERDLTKPDVTALENFSKSLRYARIVDVYDSSVLEGSLSEQDKYGKASIIFLDSVGSSPVLVPFLVPWYSWTRGSGILAIPEANDIVACVEQVGGYPQIIGFLPYKWDEATNSLIKKDNTIGNIRPLKKGEILLKSSYAGEVYLNKSGSVELVASDPSVNENVITSIDGNCSENIFTRVLPTEDAKISRTVIGNSYLIDGNVKYVGNSPVVFESGKYLVKSQSLSLPYSQELDFILSSDTELVEIESVKIVTLENNRYKSTYLRSSQYSIVSQNIYNTGSSDPGNIDYRPATTERNSFKYTLYLPKLSVSNANVVIDFKSRSFISGIRFNSLGDIFIDGRNVIMRSTNENASLSLTTDGKADLRGAVSTTLGETNAGCLKCSGNTVGYSTGVATPEDSSIVQLKPEEMMGVVNDTDGALFYISDALPLIRLYKENDVWKYKAVTEDEYSSYDTFYKASVKKICLSYLNGLFTEDELLKIMDSSAPSYSTLKGK